MIYAEDILKSLYQDMEKLLDPWVVVSQNSLVAGVNSPPEPPKYPKITNKYDLRFLWDIGYKTSKGRNMSSKQATLLVKILSKYSSLLLTLGYDDYTLETFFNAPSFRTEPYVSHECKREVRYLGDGLLAFRFLFNPQILDEIKKIINMTNKQDLVQSNSYFEKHHRIWIVEVTKGNYQKLMKLIKSFSFGFDEEVEYLFLLCENSDSSVSINKLQNTDYEFIVIDDKIFSGWLDNQIKMEKLND